MPPTNTEINTDFIVEEYGRIYQQRGQGLDRIKRALIQNSVTLEKYATHKRLTDDIYEMANDEFRPILQPFRVPFEPTGGVKFHPNKIVLQHIKVDLEFSPDQIIDAWLGFLEGEGVKREQWPITKYMIEVYLKQQIDYDREVNAVYYGERDDAGTTPAACMDGIRKHLIDGANSEYPVNVISGIGRLQPDTCFDQVEFFSKKIKGIYRKVPMIICVSQDYERCFLENKRANGFYWLHGPEDLNASVDFTKQVVMGLPSMGEECGDMFAFVRGNLLWCTRKDKFNFDVQKIDRYVKVLGDWREGIGFGVNKMVWTTDETVGASSTDVSPDEPDGIVVRDIPVRVTSAKASEGNIDVTFKVNREVVKKCLNESMFNDQPNHEKELGIYLIPDHLRRMHSDAEINQRLLDSEEGTGYRVWSGHLNECFFNSPETTVFFEELDRLQSEGEEIGMAAFAKKYGLPENEMSVSSFIIHLAYHRAFGDQKYLECRISVNDPTVFTGGFLRAIVSVKVDTDVYTSVPFPILGGNEAYIYIDETAVNGITENSANGVMHVVGGQDGMVTGYELSVNDGNTTDGVSTHSGVLSSGSSTFSLNDLTADTTYKIRFFVKVDGAKKFTPWQSFKTLSE